MWLCPSLPTETLKWPSSLPILMQKSFWWWQCSDRYIISLSPHLHTLLPPFSPFLISLMVLWSLIRSSWPSGRLQKQPCDFRGKFEDDTFRYPQHGVQTSRTNWFVLFVAIQVYVQPCVPVVPFALRFTGCCCCCFVVCLFVFCEKVPERRPGMSSVISCLESHGCHTIPLFSYLLSRFST